MGIHKSLAVGKKGQQIVRDLLLKHQIHSSHNDDYATREHHDIHVEQKDGWTWRPFTIEVKYDLMSARTGNIAIEYYNSKSCKPSGIGCTKANIWAHVLPDNSVWFVSCAELLKFTNDVKPLRLIYAGGDNNADLKLYTKDDILAIFVQMDVLNTKDFIETVQRMLKEV